MISSLGRLAILASHPVQYYAPLFRNLARRTDIHVFYAHKATPEQQAIAGFGAKFDWDIDLTSGYEHSWLTNVSKSPGTSKFDGCDTPDITNVLEVGQFDSLLVMGWHLKSMLQGMWAAKRLGIKLLVRGDSQLSTPRSLAKRAGKKVVYPLFLKLFDAALYVGQRNKAYYQHYHFSRERLFHSPHCVDNERFRTAATKAARDELRSRLAVPPNAKMILFAGKLIPVKRPLDVVESTSKLIASGLDARVLVAGAGQLEDQLCQKAKLLGVPIYSLGFQNQTEMPNCYAASDALLLPSRETWGLVGNEALACGRPIVVSSEVGCSADLAADGIVGRTFDFGNPEAAADALARLFAAPPTQAQIRAVSDRHSLDAATNGILEALAMIRSRTS